MPKFVLYSRKNQKLPRDIALINRIKTLCVIDHEIVNALLIEAAEEDVEKLRELLPNWIIEEEVGFESPDVGAQQSKESGSNEL